MFQKFTLNNGLRIVCEQIPYVRSLSIGIWVGTGSRNETLQNNGVSHFIEHMLFKGTYKRSAKQIAECIDNIGGQLNAFTGKECTCFYAKVLDTHADIAIELLADIFFNSRISDNYITIEKRVILEEIKMYEDSPEDIVHDLFAETVWADNSLGFPILGSPKSLRKINRKVIANNINDNYTPQNSVISIAGNFDSKNLLKLLEKEFGKWGCANEHIIKSNKAEFTSRSMVKHKDTEQVHACMGFKGIEQGNDRLYPLLAVNNIFGGGMSSRLFQKIRETKGLVYSIYSYPAAYKYEGLFCIYAGMNPEHFEKVLYLIIEEIRKIISKGITKDELEKSKEQLKGSFILGLESTSSRMNSIGKSELLLGRIKTTTEVLSKINSISLSDINEIINMVFNLNNISFSAVGTIPSDFKISKIL